MEAFDKERARDKARKSFINFSDLAHIEEYFDVEHGFIPEKLGQDIQEIMPFISMYDNGEIYYQDDEGIWRANGDALVRELTVDILGERFKKHYGEEVVYYVKSKYGRNRDIFNAPLNLIPLMNGVLDIETMTLRPYDRTDYFQSKIPVYFDPAAKCETISAFLKSVVNTEEELLLLKEVLAYCLWRAYPIHKGVMLHGEGRNGKSVFINLIKMFLGQENIISLSLQELETDRFAKGDLYQKYANIYADISDKALLTTGVFKQLIGNDNISADRKFKGRINFVNFAKMIFSCNKVPEAFDDSNAYFARWIIIKFPNVFEGNKADTNILQKITTASELSGLFNELVLILKDLINRQVFRYAMTTEQIREVYKRLSNPVEAFVMDCLEGDSEAWIPKKEVYRYYITYCKIKNLPIVSDNIFAKSLIKAADVAEFRASYQDHDQNVRVQSWRGIKLTEKFMQEVSHVKDVSVSVDLKVVENISNNNKMVEMVDNTDEADKNQATPITSWNKTLYNTYKNIILDICDGKSMPIDSIVTKFEDRTISRTVVQNMLDVGLLFEVHPGVVRRV